MYPLQIGNKSEKWQCRHNLPTWRHRLPFFWPCSVFLASLVTGPSFMSISLLVLELWQFPFMRLTRNSEIENTPVWTLPNICRLGRVWDTKCGMNVSNEMLVNSAKCYGYSFSCFSVIKGKPTGGERGTGLKFPPHYLHKDYGKQLFMHVEKILGEDFRGVPY